MTQSPATEAVVGKVSPRHIAIIMDGNGRWAQSRGKARIMGHKQGVEAVRETVRCATRLGVESLTLFAFSSENWRRPEEEVNFLMELFLLVLGREVKKLHKNNIKLNIIGDCSAFSERLKKKIGEAQALTAGNTGLVLNVAANYGGCWDITHAAQQLAEQVARGELQSSDITESLFAQQLSLSEQPPVDLMIRTGGDHRISNFLLWQLAYAELYFTDTLWPDFGEQAFSEAVAVFLSRERRFGYTGAQVRAWMNDSK
ncbi:polyprenyl diphosphate synthase [Gallaecimonas pentaromativorans]|uniref:Ditrans,polycis-undecaprenyl-diphosphate synthase ((2E,6E)-farnesyl-diphosphate specific) n=1 Tax=Gallaecimonas pentaromativorans TaxID=584787 RepID=A0A3N1PIQ7_9GAMM|nr:polyprenyl diphosphate synthase [Gallaecimonas pentaromativorans]MED5524462.1 polyprenyl diphosphate synthase [Pseudomonadota bacterium]ROQ28473.1 undecaprenyl pyrophosphate synthetase [Gallaecimonas pentaromativorans]